MNRMTDEQIRMAKNVIELSGKSAGVEDLYRKKAMDTTGDPENWVQVLLVDMILVGVPCVMRRAEIGKEEDERMKLASSNLTKAVTELTLLARSITISETDFETATSALSTFAAIFAMVKEHEHENGSVEKGISKSEVYIKNDNKNPLW